jgi:hypothetical protein
VVPLCWGRSSKRWTTICGAVGAPAGLPHFAASGPADAKLGDHPSFTITPATAGQHLVRCHFYAPDGTFLHNYATNVVFDGASGTVVLPSAVNDAPGQYTLKATDVMTGASAEAKITLQ